MAKKVLFQTALTALKSTDVESLGVLRSEGNKTYKWVKNYCSTSLGRSGPCLAVLSSVDAAQGKKVCSQDTSATYTATLLMPAGQPVSAIGPSGSATGDHGWIIVKGHTRGSVVVTSVAGASNHNVVGTTVIPATPSWGFQATAAQYGATLQGAAVEATTTPATAVYERSTSIYIHCLE